MMRSQEEIVQRIRQVTERNEDFFGVIVSDLICCLDYDHAKEFLKEDVTPEQWEEAGKEIKTPREEMISYMPFAWEKANDKRGLSANRTMDHYRTWLWLVGEEELSKSCEDYEYYGKPQLIAICEYLGLDPAEWDDGVRENY